jgi:cation:H+ antiporter
MTINLIAIVFGFIGLVWTADRFVFGSSAIAKNLGVAPIIIGLTIVGFGTSAPEIFVSAIAAWQGSPILGIGNALGSNIANIGLILGVTVLIAPLYVRSETLKREFPMLLLVTLFAFFLVFDNFLGFWDGAILIAVLVLMLFWLVKLALAAGKSDPIVEDINQELTEPVTMSSAITWFAIGLIGLLISSKLLVWGAVNIAHAFGVSELIIGLTIVAIGTSLPELAASVIGVLKNEHDLVVGNVIGSNMFNMLIVFGLPGIISPTHVPNDLLVRDFPVVIIMTILLVLMVYGFRRSGKIKFSAGVVLLLVYLGYQGRLVYMAMAN